MLSEDIFDCRVLLFKEVITNTIHLNRGGYRCFSVMFTHERGRLFHGEGADLTCIVLFASIDGPF